MITGGLWRCIGRCIALWFLGSGATMAHAQGAMDHEVARPDIWLTPFAPYTSSDGTRRGAPDYLDLFGPQAPWTYTASHIKVFKIYRDQVVLMPDSVLETIIRGLQERHIALAMESNILLDTSVCGTGAAKAQPITPVLERLKRLGADLRYLAMNEPLAGGHFSRDPTSCQASIEAVAADVANSLRPLYQVYPALQVGDIEPVGHLAEDRDWPAAVAQWMSAFQTATGKPLAFMHADTVWGRIWQADLQRLAQLVRAAGVPFGVIYDGDFTEMSDTAWAANTARYAADVEDGLGIKPDQAIFQSWDKWPQHTLPDHDLTTMTGMVRDYLRQRSKLLVLPNRQIRIVDELGAPIGEAKIEVQRRRRRPLDPRIQDLAAQEISGQVPPRAVSALFGLRINAECRCRSVAADLDIANFAYGEQGDDGGYDHARFNWDLHQWERDAPDNIRLQSSHGPPIIHIAASPTTSLVLNGPRFPAHADAQFKAQFQWQINEASSEAGYALMVFFGANGIETRRTLYRFGPTWDQLKTLTSDDNGTVALSTESLDQLTRGAVQLLYGGDMKHRPTELQFGAETSAR